MKATVAICIALLAAIAIDASAVETIVADTSVDAFARPMQGLLPSERERFFNGRSLIHQSWVVAPSKDASVSGLGPLYNSLACISCHPRNGRGRPPDEPDERMQSTLVRLSVAGQDAHGGPRPHPVYGGQLNEEGIPGVPGEGRAAIHWEDAESVTLAGGATVSLRRPRLEFQDLAYGPLEPVMTSLRVGQQLVGLGLLDAVPAAALRRLAAQPKADGVAGRVNQVWNPETGHVESGRFGYKANMPTLRVQVAGAFLGDIGITSALFPEENCTPAQIACRRAPSGGHPELSRRQLDDIVFYLSRVAIPARRHADDPTVRRGERAFAEIGCAACHRPALSTARQSRFPQLSATVFHPYTDLLIHDMGEGLSDGRPDFLASGREWRTPPLWGIGLAPKVGESERYLHDGRARSLTEAILWHAGEASAARARFAALPAEDRQTILEFLSSL